MVTQSAITVPHFVYESYTSGTVQRPGWAGSGRSRRLGVPSGPVAATARTGGEGSIVSQKVFELKPML